MNSEERKELALQDAIIRKRESLQIAYNLYKMGYCWNYKEALIDAGFEEVEVDSACNNMYVIFENTLCCLNMMIGEKITEAYDDAQGQPNVVKIRQAREYGSMLTKLMLDNGTRLYSDMESIAKGLLLYVARYTLYEFGCEHDEAFTLFQMEQITD